MNMIESAKAQVRQLTVAAYEKAAAAGLLPAGITAEPAVEIPKSYLTFQNINHFLTSIK